MKSRLKNLSIIIILVFALVFFISLFKVQKYDTSHLIGVTIPNFTIKNFDGVERTTHLELKNNNYTLINFWASWCKACIEEHEQLMKIKNNLDVKILGIYYKDNKKNAKNFLIEHGNPFYKILKDKSGKASVNLGIYAIPESILINKDLIVLKKIIGPINQKNYNEIVEIIK